MLVQDPEKRISAVDALQDSWFASAASKAAVSEQEQALTSLSKFHAESKLQEAALTIIISQMVNRNEEQQLRENFKLLDKNGNGQISREELLEGYMAMYANRLSKQEILD